MQTQTTQPTKKTPDFNTILLTPVDKMALADAKKVDRAGPRNFRAMGDQTVVTMAHLTFGRPFACKADACAALEELPFAIQHRLDKSRTKRLAQSF